MKKRAADGREPIDPRAVAIRPIRGRVKARFESVLREADRLLLEVCAAPLERGSQPVRWLTTTRRGSR
ncbi:MAG: hypothetical protein QOD06_608 [Candidatus Binatota bacterium]|jgi:hypothetical protein|nr:hypothetical protein [Candidatus Binatota bacterium]